MKSQQLGILSALTASVCCLGPVVFVLLGLGSLGVGAFLGRFHWWFIAVAMILLTIAWRSYLAEAHRCKAASCEMARGRTTRATLTVASVVVAIFVGLNLYTYAGQPHRPPAQMASALHDRVITAHIPVEGMTCFTCELAVEASVKGLPGVHHIDAKVKEAAAYVQYDPAQVTMAAVIAAINKTGYRARRPRTQGDG